MAVKDAQVIRKLSRFESMLDNEVMHNNMLQIRTFIVSISNQHLIDTSVLQKAAHTWIQLHPLLQATIIRELDTITQKPNLFLPRWFVYTQKRVNDYKNVELIDVPDCFEWKKLVESELKNAFDWVNGPLWRIKILKDNTCRKESSSTRYAFILSNSHAVSDGRNGFALGIQFFDILIDFLENRPSLYLADVFGQFEMDSLIERMKSRPSFKVIKESSDFDLDTHRIPKHVGNKKNGVHGKFNNLKLDKSKLDGLVKQMKSKAPKAKLTALMCALISHAYTCTCILHKVDDFSLDKIQMCVMVSMREKFSVPYIRMGAYPTSLNCVINVDLNQNKSDFWRLVETNSIQFHKRIEKNEEFAHFDHELQSFGDLVNTHFDFVNHSPLNFAVSNIGVMKNTKDEGVLKVDEHYLALPCMETRMPPFLYFGLSTVNNTLCLAISYNERLFSNEFINDLKENFLKQVEKFTSE